MIKHTLAAAGLMVSAFASISCTGSNSEPGITPSPVVSAPEGVDAELKRLKLWLSGSFSSRQQSIDDARYFDIHLRSVPIWVDREDAEWLYVEQAAAQALDRPYRQRVYKLTRESDGSLMSTVYALPGDPMSYAGAWRTPAVFDAISPSDLSERIGCAIVLEWEATSGSFIGSTVGNNCQSSLSGATYATAEVTLKGNELRSWDRGYDAADEQVWGAQAGPYIFRRLDAE